MDYSYSEARLINRQQISENIFLISLEKLFDFVPGQSIGIKIGDQMHRLYSICSGNLQHEIEILFDVRKDGYLTPLLANMDLGSTVLVTKPSGAFTDRGHPAYYIAAGTGIAPFMSMIRSGAGFNNVLIHGAKKETDFFFKQDLQSALKERYIQCCSQEEITDGYNGRLTKYLTEKDDLPKTWDYFLCGSPQMVVESRDILIAKGIDYHNIISEIFY